jgi:hypothetical protein
VLVRTDQYASEVLCCTVARLCAPIGTFIDTCCGVHPMKHLLQSGIRYCVSAQHDRWGTQ